ncbi:MAG: hypothetical protein PHY50_01665 [Sideroxydans sp.]|nr:hypothetical protein [Sideroxydans sp.]
MSNQFLEKSQQFIAESKRRFVALPLEKQWFGSAVGFVIGFIIFAGVLRFDPKSLIHPIWLLKLAVAYMGVIFLLGLAYKKWQGERFDGQRLFPRVLGFLLALAYWGIILAFIFYDAIVLIFF